MRIALAVALLIMVFVSSKANAWFFFIPIPNVAKPAPLQTTIDALEKSAQTRALAFNSEDKSFGSKQWVWGSYSGDVTQEEANRLALERCENSLRNAKSQSAGGQPLYNFGDKRCELYAFAPNDGPKIAEARKQAAEEEARKIAVAAEAKRLAAEEEAKKLAAAEEIKRLAAAEEVKRLATEDEARRAAAAEEATRLAAEEEAKRIAAEEDSKRLKAAGSKKRKVADTSKQLAVKPVALASIQVDFNTEANKAAKILGCQSSDAKVTGVEGGNIQYTVVCDGSRTLNLSCDPSGLCLQKKPDAGFRR